MLRSATPFSGPGGFYGCGRRRNCLQAPSSMLSSRSSPVSEHECAFVKPSAPVVRNHVSDALSSESQLRERVRFLGGSDGQVGGRTVQPPGHCVSTAGGRTIRPPCSSWVGGRTVQPPASAHDTSNLKSQERLPNGSALYAGALSLGPLGSLCPDLVSSSYSLLRVYCWPARGLRPYRWSLKRSAGLLPSFLQIPCHGMGQPGLPP